MRVKRGNEEYTGADPEEIYMLDPTVSANNTDRGYFVIAVANFNIAVSVVCKSTLPDSFESTTYPRGTLRYLIEYFKVMCPERKYKGGAKIGETCYLILKDTNTYVYQCKANVTTIVAKSNRTNIEQSLQMAISKMRTRYRDTKNLMYASKGDYGDSLFKVSVSNSTLFSTMNAIDYTGKFDKIPYPVYLQEKLDGVRVLLHVRTEPESENWLQFSETKFVYMTSRNGSDLSEKLLPAFKSDIRQLPDGHYTLDGEVYIPGVQNSVINGIVNAIEDPNKKTLEFWLFDFIEDNNFEVVYGDRKRALRALFENHEFRSFRRVETHVCKDSESLDEFMAQAVEKKLEGWMGRTNSYYAPGARNRTLFKLKIYNVETFVVIDIVSAVGAEEGLGMLVIKHNKKRVQIRPTLTSKERTKMLKYKDKYIGLMVQIKYYGIMENGGLRFPTMVEFVE